MVQVEDLPTLTVVVNSNVENTLSPNCRGVLPRLMLAIPSRPRVMTLSKRLVSDICSVASVDQDCVRLSTLREQARLRRTVRRNLDTTINAASVDQQVAANMLLHERMRIIFLLNTLGGSVDVSDRLIQLASKVRKNGGEVWAYGREKVSSAGAMIFMAADSGRRVLVKRTPLMFHLSTHARRHHTHKRPDCLIAEERKREIAELRMIFVTNSVHRDYARYLTRSVRSVDEKTPLGDDTIWTISDLEAEQFWHVRRRGIASTRASYIANIGEKRLAYDWLKQPEAKAVRKFFR